MLRTERVVEVAAAATTVTEALKFGAKSGRRRKCKIKITFLYILIMYTIFRNQLLPSLLKIYLCTYLQQISIRQFGQNCLMTRIRYFFQT